MRKIASTVGLVLLFAALLIGGGLAARASAAGHERAWQQSVSVNAPSHGRLPATMRRECAQEDSVNCWWNDGGGHPFIVRLFPGKAHLTCYMYEQARFAARHDYCFSAHREGLSVKRPRGCHLHDSNRTDHRWCERNRRAGHRWVPLHLWYLPGDGQAVIYGSPIVGVIRVS